MQTIGSREFNNLKMNVTEWLQAGNTFVESEVIMEGEDSVINESSARVIAARLLVKQEKGRLNF